MNKKVLCISIIVLCLIIAIICFALHGYKNNNNSGGEVTGGWTLNSDIKSMNISKDAMNAFNRAAEDYTGMTFEPIALLGTQVVAGTNYMFLCKGTTVTKNPETSLKIVIVYNDLNDKSEITSVSDFDYTKYVSKNIENDSEELSGGWQVSSSGNIGILDDDIQTMFNKATSTLTGMSYEPIALLGTQVVAGTNYAILCYGSASYDNMPEAIYLLTLYKDLDGNQEITSQAYVDISVFNQ